ncbi:MAG: deaminase [Candidatus Nanopelagicales bacterium]
MSRDEINLERARKVAARSECNAKHGAVLVKSGRVLAVAVNTQRNDPGVVPKGCVTVHAEVNVLKRVDEEVAKGAVLYVARHNGGLSKPCPACAAVLGRAGVQRVVWTRGAAGEG